MSVEVPGNPDRIHSYLSNIPGVKAVHFVRAIPVPKPNRSEEYIVDGDSTRRQVGSFAALVGGPLQAIGIDTSEISGRGVKVGIVDTGIDYRHPALGGGFGPKFKVQYGYDFADNDTDPLDLCFGHGTHVAGIIAANPDGVVRGVAPSATLGAYKVFSCGSDYTPDDVVLKGVEGAVRDRMDVINLSLGEDYSMAPDSPLGQGLLRYVRSGGVAVVANGNKGPQMFSVGHPASAPWTMGIGSVLNPLRDYPVFSVNLSSGSTRASTNSMYIPYTTPDDLLPGVNRPYLVVRTGTVSTRSDACSTKIDVAVKGKIALVRRGGCSYEAKVQAVQKAGAVAAFIYDTSANIAPFDSYIFDRGENAVTIPAVFISRTDGLRMSEALQAGHVIRATFVKNKQRPYRNPLGLSLSRFSAFGPAPDLSLKPNLLAPGEGILSTFINNTHQVMDGTSMATPMVTGAVTLMKVRRPKLNASIIDNIFQTTCEPVAIPPDSADVTGLEPAYGQGSGLLQLTRALDASFLVSPPQLEVGDFSSRDFVIDIRPVLDRPTIQAPNTFDISHQATITCNDQYGVFDKRAAAVTIRPSSITLSKLKPSAQVRVRIVSSALALRSFYGGYIVFTARNSTQKYRVAYAGFVGDYPRLFPPLLAESVKLMSADYFTADPNQVFSLKDDSQLPAIEVGIGMPARSIRLQLLLQNDDIEEVVEEQVDNEVGTEQGADGNSPFYIFRGWRTDPYTGQRVRYPRGAYFVTVTVQSWIAKGRNPKSALLQTFRSPKFRISY